MSVAVGIGCRKGCTAGAIAALVHRALDCAPNAAPLGLFTLVDKRDEAGIIEAAGLLCLPLVYLTREALLARAGEAKSRSRLAENLFGVPSVAEAAALAGAGPASVLIVPRITEGGATCAIAGSAP